MPPPPPKQPTQATPLQASQSPVAVSHTGDPTHAFSVSVPTPNADPVIPELAELIHAAEFTIAEHDLEQDRVVVHAPPQQKKLRYEDLDAINRRIETLENHVNASLLRIHKGMLYLTGIVEKFREDYKDISTKLDHVTETTILKKLAVPEHTFPFDSYDALDAYLRDDPDMVRLIERYVRH